MVVVVVFAVVVIVVCARARMNNELASAIEKQWFSSMFVHSEQVLVMCRFDDCERTTKCRSVRSVTGSCSSCYFRRHDRSWSGTYLNLVIVIMTFGVGFSANSFFGAEISRCRHA